MYINIFVNLLLVKKIRDNIYNHITNKQFNIVINLNLLYFHFNLKLLYKTILIWLNVKLN